MDTFDLEMLRRGHEQRDAQLLTSLYAEDSEIRIVDSTNPPSSPKVLNGKAQISEFLADVCSRDMSHRIENPVVRDDRAGFNVACQYADGTRVLASEICDIRDGKISREVMVQAWDS